MRLLAVLVALTLAPAARAQAGDVPTATDAAETAGEADGLKLESYELPGRIYFRETTLKGFLAHPEPPAALRQDLLERDRAVIEARYKDRGYLRARVELDVVQGLAPRGRVARYTIDAGPRAELRAVHIVGNERVDDEALKEGLFSRPPEPFGVITKAGMFHKPFLDQDGQRVVANYYRRGYLEARVLDTLAVATSDLDAIEVTMRVHEGRVYELSGVTFTGDLPPGETSETLRDQLTLKNGDVADLVTVQQEADKLMDAHREQGYAFVRLEQAIQVADPPSGAPDRRGIALTFNIVTGPVVQIARLRLEGNEKTMDHVIERDVTVEEGGAYKHSELARTKARLMSLGFFQQVEVRPVRIPGSDDTVDIEVTVKEIPTWIVSAAPSFTGSEGLIGIGVLADRNLFGTGMFGSFQGIVSGLRQTFDVSLTEPRVLGSRVSATVEMHRREQTYFSEQVAEPRPRRGPDALYFDLLKGLDLDSRALTSDALALGPAFFRWRAEFGGGASVAVPVGLGFAVSGGVLVEYGGVMPYAGADPVRSELFPGRACDVSVPPPPGLDVFARLDHTFQNLDSLSCDGVFKNRISLGALWDRRDSVLTPRNGAYASANVSYSGPLTLSGISALRTTGAVRLYWSPVWDITIKTNTQLGFVVNPHGGTVPATERFYVGGGIGSVRGFFASSIGPERLVRMSGGGAAAVNVGGVFNVLQNTELEFPILPGTPFRGFVFLDFGNAFGEDEPWFSSEIERGRVHLPFNENWEAFLPFGMYVSTGAGAVIETPALPLRFQFGVPLTRRAIDPSPVDFLFWVGSAF